MSVKRYEIIYPESSTRKAIEEYEYLLTWYNSEGAQVSWMFYDWENRLAVSTVTINENSNDRVSSLVSSAKRRVKFTAEDVTRGELALLESMLTAKTIFRIYRTDSELFEPGTYEKLAVISSGSEWINSKQRFKFDIELQCKNLPVWS